MNIIVIVHNEYDALLEWIRNAQEKNIDLSNVVIVDNYSDDGLAEALKGSSFNYILCDEKEEAYSTICNTVIKEFGFTKKVYVTSPQYLPTDNMLFMLEHTLDNFEDIAAISPLIFNDVAGLEALLKADDTGDEFFVTFNIQPMCVMYNLHILSELNGFDEQLFCAGSAVKDYVFRALMCKYKCAGSRITAAMIYSDNFAVSDDEHEMENDREVLKRKWNMNYFNTIPNYSIVSMLECNRNLKINVLEIGCDCGATLLEIKRHFKNASLYGVEINENAAKIAANIINIKVGNIEEQNIEFDGVKFDYIIFGDVLEHLHAPDKVVAYCKKLLKAGGRIIASIPNLAYFIVIRELLKGNFTYADVGLLDRTHIHFFTFNEILRLFINEGYKIETINTVSGNLNETDRNFVHELLKISPESDEHIFTTYQYLVSAVYDEM